MGRSSEDAANPASSPSAALAELPDVSTHAGASPSARAEGERSLDSPARSLHLLMFGSLYFAQGAMVAYFSNFQKPYLNSLGISANAIGALSSLLLLPFILKIFMGLLTDRVSLFGGGYRKPYILLGLVLSMGALLGAISVRPDASLGLYAGLLFLASVGMALFDTAADGLAVDITEPHSQGTVQASMVAGRAVGLVVISWFGGVLAGRQSYSTILLVIALCLVVPLVWVFTFREPLRGTRKRPFEWRALGELLKPRLLLFSAYMFTVALIMWGGINGLIAYYMSHDLGADPAQIGRYGALVGVGSIAGAFAAGLSLDRWRARMTAYLAVPCISLVAVLLGLATQISWMYPLGLIWGVVFGFQQTVLVALAMRLTDLRVPASMFTIMMTFANVGLAVGEGVTTSLSDNFGFSRLFWLLAAVNFIVVPLLWALFRTLRGGATATDSARPSWL